jgi:hypothetical protein
MGACRATTPSVVLVHYRPGWSGESATVHVVPLPAEEHTGAIGTVRSADARRLADAPRHRDRHLGEGMPCTLWCIVNRMTSTASISESPAGSSADGTGVEVAAGRPAISSGVGR